MENSANISKAYNLRCNRSVSEKMLKEDFVYDMRRPLQIIEKKSAVSLYIMKM